MNASTLLVVDDEQVVRWSLKQRLTEEGYRVVEAATAADALTCFARGVDLVLLDQALPDGDGLSVLRSMQAQESDVPVIMLTGHSSVGAAVAAMRAGAFDYTTKPVELDDVVLAVERALKTTALRREVRALRRSSSFTATEMVVASPQMQEVAAMLSRVAQSPASTILLTGETGTGKNLAAQAVHRQSDRRGGPFLNVTCSAIPATLLEVELFGHEPGAFTDARARKRGLLEVASGGTVFLDEVGELEPVIQAKLLGFLEQKMFRRIGGLVDIRADVRIIAATNADLEQAVEDGRFRRDLYYRLAVLCVQLPPLRSRTEDVPLLVKHFIDQFNGEFGRAVAGVSPAAIRLLSCQSWPGNVRELRNLVERAMLLARGTELDVGDFEPALASRRSKRREAFRLPPEGVDLGALERSMVTQALEACDQNQTRAAVMLGLSRDQVRYRMAKYELLPANDRAGDQVPSG